MQRDNPNALHELRGPTTHTSWSTPEAAESSARKSPKYRGYMHISRTMSTLPSPDGMRQIAALLLKSPVPAGRLSSAWRSETLPCQSRVLPIGHGAEIAEQHGLESSIGQLHLSSANS